MTKPNTPNFRLTLTLEQKAMIRKATGKNADAIDLSVKELEQRIAPSTVLPSDGDDA